MVIRRLDRGAGRPGAASSAGAGPEGEAGLEAVLRLAVRTGVAGVVPPAGVWAQLQTRLAREAMAARTPTFVDLFPPRLPVPAPRAPLPLPPRALLFRVAPLLL